MIFKTFENNDIDKWTAKIGLFGKSFNDVIDSINKRKLDIDNLMSSGLVSSHSDAKKQVGGLFSYLYSKNDIKSQLIDVDSVFPKIDESQAKSILQQINNIENGVDEEINSFQELYDTGNKQKQWIAKYAQETQGQIRSTEGLISANEKARASTIAHNNALKQQTLGAKAANVALKGLAMAGNMLVSLGISAIISLAVKGLDNLVHAADNAKESAESFSNSFKSMNEEFTSNDSKLSDLQKQYDELSKGVNSLGENISLTTDEYDTYKQVISEISDMMPNLLARYDDEGNKIGFVQGKLKDLSAEYDNYKKKKAMDLVNGENDNGDSIKDVFKNYGYQIRHENADGTVVGNTKAFGSSNYEKITQLQAQIKYGDGNHAGFSKLTNEEIEEKTALIQKYQSEIDASVSSIQDAMIAIGQSGNEYYKLSDKQQQFFDTYIGSLSQDAIDKNGLYNETAARIFVNNFIKDIKADKNKVLEAYNDLLSFDVNDSSLNPEQIKEQVDKLLQALAKALGDEDWQDLKIRLGFEFVDDNASDYEKFVDRTKNKLSKFGGEGTGKLMNFFSANGIDSSKGVNEFLDVYNATEQAKKGIYDADIAMQEWIKHSKEASDTSTPTTLSSAWEQLKSSTEDATKGVADDLQTLADKGELTIDTFKATDGAENYFDNLGYSAEEAVKYINSLSDKNSQLGAMSKNIESITNALGTKASDGLVSVDDLSGFDATIKGLNTWEKFSTILGDASSSMEDCQKVANELATEYVNSESVLSNLNETNRAYYESQLDNMGVTNSAAVVEAVLAKNLGEEKIATEEAAKAGLSLHGTKIDTTNATELFSNATAGEIIQLANEANQSGVSSQALALLAVKKLNNPTLTTDGDIKNLMDLCKGLDLATQAIKTFQSIKNSVMNPDGTFKATGTAGAQQSEALNNAFNAMKSLVKTSVGGASVNSHGSSGGGTSGGGGGGSSSTAKTAFDKLSDWASQFFDWIEVRLDRLQKKIDSNISKAESKLNDKRYSSATVNYMSAVGNTYTKMYTEQKGRDKYLNTANNYLNKAISLGAINKKLAKEIKTRVADGSINISRYSSDIQTVISTYKDWIDKAKDCTTAMQTLHDSLRTYAEDLKKVSDAQRDATVSIAETKQTIATGVQNTATAKNSSLGYNNSVLNTKNSAYYTAAKSANSNVNKFAKSATSALNKGKIKKNTKYNATLNSIKGYIKKRVAIPDSLLAIVAKKNSTLYNRLYMYNLSIENLQTAREEYTTAFTANNAEKYNNIADKYKNLDDATNDAMDLNSTKSSNAVSAKDKNSYLDKQKSGYGTIVTHDKNEQDAYDKDRKSARSSMSKSAKGTSYNSLSTKNRATVNKYVNDARSSAKNGKIIAASTIAKLSEYYKKGYITRTFLDSCINYNNALESYNQAKAQAEIDKQTQIAQRAEIASQKFSNIATEYDNKRHQYDQTATELNNNMSILEERGNGASANWYSKLVKNEESSRSNLIQKRTDLVKELNNAVKNGDVAYKSEKWYEMRSQIDDVTNSIDEATKSLAEYNNQIMQVHWDRIDEQANKVQNLIDENNFIIDELSRRDLTSDDTGGLTSEGNAVAGLHISKYEAYKKNAETYYAEIESINKKLANDPYNQKLIDQKEKLVKSYQDCVKGAEDEKWATIDLMKSGYDALKNHISDLIDKFNDLLDSEKDAYDYANNISEKTKTLSDLHKQLVAISGDTSEETRAKAQGLNQSLKDAEKDLKDTQYDKLISSTKDMLSDFQTDLDDSIQNVIKNLDDNFSQLIESIDSHWNNETITSLMEKIQYVATDSFNNVSADGKISESTGNVVSDIQSFMERAWAKYDRDAETTQQDKIDEATKEEVKNNILNNSNSGSSSGSSTDVKIDANKLISRIDNPTNKISPAYNNTTTNTNSTAPVGKVLSTSQKKWVNDFLKKNIVVAKQDVSKYGNLNKVLYRNWGKKILPTSKWTELAKKIGFSNFSSATNSAFYQTLHRSGIKGFKKGSDSIPYDMIANLGENGTELQYDVSKGVLKSVGQGDMIFTAEQAKTLMEFAKNPMAYKNMYTGTAFSMPSVPVNNKVDNDVNISIGDIKLEGVQDPKQLANGIKDIIKNNTGGVRSMIKEDTIGSLSKGYNSQSVKRW